MAPSRKDTTGTARKKKMVIAHVVHVKKKVISTLKKLSRIPAERKRFATIQKHEGNPIIEPRGGNFWEVKATFNPAAVKLKVYHVISPERIDVVKIKEFVPDMQKPMFYISGPEPMVESLGNALKGAGVPADHLKQDFFPGYPAE